MAMAHPNTDSWRARSILRATCVLALLICSSASSIAQSSDPASPPESTADDASTEIPPEQLQALVAPIALYPDDLLAQALVASTYPLEIIQLQQWLTKNPDLEGDALTEALEAQPWDPSIKSMAAIPEVVDRLANDIQWTTDLGNAFLAQQDDVMAAAQTMRKKAQQKGSLESSEQMTVETQIVERDTIIIVESADPEVIYVPSYDPVVVYPPVVYAYPPIYYPPPPPGGLFIAFSIGVAWGRHYGGPCCGCGWGRGGNNIYINNSNNFYNSGNRGDGNRGGSRDWNHDPEHRGAAPYGDRKTADKYGGRTSRDAPSNRGGASTRPSAGTSDRGGAGDRPSAGAADRGGAGDRPSAGTADRGANADRSGQRDGGDRPAASDRSAGQSGASSSRDPDRSAESANRDRPQSSGSRDKGGSDHIGNRDVQKNSPSRGGGGVGGGSSHSYDRSRAQSSQSRGSASRGSRGGGGGRRR